MSAKHVAAGGAAGAAIVACAVLFTPTWEGMDKVAVVDRIGTGHPITYCYGQTDELGKVHAGQRFTKTECDEALAKSLPVYLDKIEQCIKVDLPVKTAAALLDAAYNAGTAAVCRSPMLARMNVGDIKGGCEAFDGWYVRSDGVVRKGLIARRSGDYRKGEKELCLEGLQADPVIKAEVTPDPRCDGPARYDAMREGADCSGSADPAPTPKPTPKRRIAKASHTWKNIWFR